MRARSRVTGYSIISILCHREGGHTEVKYRLYSDLLIFSLPPIIMSTPSRTSLFHEEPFESWDILLVVNGNRRNKIGKVSRGNQCTHQTFVDQAFFLPNNKITLL